jgi:ABC-type Fe3+/spermidine/putrescine transport system ATPase subunit/ABC-type sulfate transport system permease component
VSAQPRPVGGVRRGDSAGPARRAPRGGRRGDPAAVRPLAWLAALLAIYLIAPIAAFVVRLAHGAPLAPGVGGALATSLIAATISTGIIALLGLPLAYVLARARGRTGAAVSILVALPLALPPLMSGILLLYLVGPYTFLGRLFGGGLTDSLAGIVIAQTFVAAPFLVIAARAAFAAIDPDLEDVARTLGHRQLARFWRVALPAAWPGVMAGLLLAWLRAFGEFGATVILAYHPYSLPVFTFVQFDATGLPSTVAPVGAALGAALVVLAVSQLPLRRRRPAARLPAPAALRPRPGLMLSFALHKCMRGFELELEHAGSSARVAILGASGAGKTLTLRLLAGITAPDRGEIRAGSLRLGELPAEDRGVGYVPQHSALLPRRTVWQQVRLAGDADPALAAWWLGRLGLAGLEERYPDELSGGQQRRVALVRALARAPALLLLDEPLSALDAPVRARLCRELRELQREAGLSTVLVTHDPEEAALLADEVIVLDGGRALQQGAVAEVFARPASPRVAALLGLPNTHSGTIVGPRRMVAAGIELSVEDSGLAAGSPVTWAVRPERIALHPRGAYRGTVIDAVATGAAYETRISVGGLELTARSTHAPLAPPGAAWASASAERPPPGAACPPPGAACRIDLPAEAITVWPAPPAGTAAARASA